MELIVMFLLIVLGLPLAAVMFAVERLEKRVKALERKDALEKRDE